MTLTIILGNLGTGKTLLLVVLGTESDKKVFSNFTIKIPNYNELNEYILLELPYNVDVFIDEAYTWLESRTSMKTLNLVLSYIHFQSRKRGYDMYLTAQLFSSIDVRYRHLADVLVFCNTTSEGFHYTFVDKRKMLIKELVLTYEKAKTYYPLYDTKEIIEPPEMDNLKFKLLKNRRKDFNKEVKRIANLIKPKLNKITKFSVEKAIFDEGLDLGFSKYVYLELKNHLK